MSSVLAGEIVEIVSHAEHLVQVLTTVGAALAPKNNRVVGSLSSPCSERKKLNWNVQVKFVSSHKNWISCNLIECHVTRPSHQGLQDTNGRKTGNTNVAILGGASRRAGFSVQMFPLMLVPVSQAVL